MIMSYSANLEMSYSKGAIISSLEGDDTITVR